MPPPRRPATIPSTSAIGSISGTAPRGRRSETRLQLPDDRLALPGGQELRQVVRERRQPGGDLALAPPGTSAARGDRAPAAAPPPRAAAASCSPVPGPIDGRARRDPT